jgi:hypothetical protein
VVVERDKLLRYIGLGGEAGLQQAEDCVHSARLLPRACRGGARGHPDYQGSTAAGAGVVAVPRRISHLSGLLRSSSAQDHTVSLSSKPIARVSRPTAPTSTSDAKSDCRRIFGLSGERLRSGPSWNYARGVPIATTT